MTDKPDFERPRATSSKHDEQVWVDLKQSLREQYPNPQREGCPGEVVLKGLAYGRMRLAEAEGWLDHLGQCSPCFCDFERLKAEASRKRMVRAAFSAAAILLVSVSITLWLKLSHAPRNVAGSHGDQSTAGIPVTDGSPKQLAAAVVHLENPSTTRGGDSESPSPQTLPRTRLALSIYLPLSGGAGKYQIELLKDLSDPVPLLKLEGNATIESGSPVMRITTDLSALESGAYWVRFRQVGDGWRYVQVVLN